MAGVLPQAFGLVPAVIVGGHSVPWPGPGRPDT